uniref:Uncharacterized protein n=1 Tax=Pan troglodytes TaxID=9598 RepID=G2HFZ9_PANTR|nr:hypothetical protein [Pan troglodytes]
MLLAKPLLPPPLCSLAPGLFTEHLLCARHCARYWQINAYKADSVPIFMEFPLS